MSDQANHRYDLADFWAAVDHGQMPSVSCLKAAKYQDGHAGYSNPLDEQHFLVDTLNNLQKRPEWRSTAVVIAYDDSDGWYDDVLAPVQTQSQTALDTLTGAGQCGATAARVPASGAGQPQQARCGLGPRLPLLVISPFARRNFVDFPVFLNRDGNRDLVSLDERRGYAVGGYAPGAPAHKPRGPAGSAQFGWESWPGGRSPPSLLAGPWFLYGGRVDVKLVQARLGHKSAQTTIDIYGHLWPDSDERTRTAIDAVFDKPLARAVDGGAGMASERGL